MGRPPNDRMIGFLNALVDHLTINDQASHVSVLPFTISIGGKERPLGLALKNSHDPIELKKSFLRSMANPINLPIDIPGALIEAANLFKLARNKDVVRRELVVISSFRTYGGPGRNFAKIQLWKKKLTDEGVHIIPMGMGQRMQATVAKWLTQDGNYNHLQGETHFENFGELA